MSMLRAPPTMFSTTVKNPPRNTTNIMDISDVGQKMTDAGTQASGGMGRMISNTG